MNKAFIGIVIFVVAFIVNRLIMSKALSELDNEMKLKFIETFARRNTYSTILILIGFLVYFFLLNSFPQYGGSIISIFFSVIAIYLLLSFIFAYKKLREIEAPKGYINKFSNAFGIFSLGFLQLFAFAMMS